MADNAATEILDALMKNLKEILSTESIIGEPIHVGKTTIIPVMKVFVGFGAGGGSGLPGKNTDSGSSGGGGGGGLAITPVGFLVVEEGRAMMITPNSTRWDWVVESLPELWEKFTRARQEGKQRREGAAEKEGQTEGGS